VKNKIEIGLILFLVLFFISIDDPMVYPGAILRRMPTLEKPAKHVCVAEVIPKDARVLFFSNSDGSLHFNTYNVQYTQAQYELVPRVIQYLEGGRLNWEEYSWFLAIGLEASQIKQTADQHNLRVVQVCDKLTLLGRNER
jgi:hypothetical protein